MLNQSVNLYQERFREKKVPLSALQMVVVLAISIILLAVSSYWIHDQHAQATLHNQQYLEQKQQVTQQLEVARARVERLLADNKVDEKINQVSRDINVRKQMIDFVANNQFGSGKGFSDNLYGLTQVKVDNVWLDEISLSDNFVKLSGSALKAEKVPMYFNTFREQRLFNGRVFDIFELQRDRQRQWKIDFIIASKAVSDE